MSRKSTWTGRGSGTITTITTITTSTSYLMVNANQIVQPTATGEQVEESNEASIPSATAATTTSSDNSGKGEGEKDIPSAAKAPSEEEAVAAASESSLQQKADTEDDETKDKSSLKSKLNESTESTADANIDTATGTTNSDTVEETTSSSDESTSQPQDTLESSESQPPVQSGPLIDLLGEQLLSITMVDQTHAQFNTHYTNEVLSDKKVIGLYFSADWCGPCRQFTPDLVNFYNKINSKRGQKDSFEIVWISRCRDVQSYGQYFTHMGGWYALPPEQAMGQRGEELFQKYKVKGIPHLSLIDATTGGLITNQGREKIPMDKAGIGFPWRNPLVQLYTVLVPQSLRLLVRRNVDEIKDRVLKIVSMKKQLAV